jgi:hypothetical protein
MKWIPFEVNFAAYKCRMIDPLHLVQPKHSILSQAIAWYLFSIYRLLKYPSRPINRKSLRLWRKDYFGDLVRRFVKLFRGYKGFFEVGK